MFQKSEKNKSRNGWLSQPRGLIKGLNRHMPYKEVIGIIKNSPRQKKNLRNWFTAKLP